MADAAQSIRPTPAAAVASSWHTRWFLVAFYLLAVSWGFRNSPLPPSRLDALFPLLLSLCLGWWAVADARRRHYPIPMLSQQWFILLAGLAVPAYVLWSRGWRGAGWMALHGLLWQVLATVALYAAAFAILG